MITLCRVALEGSLKRPHVSSLLPDLDNALFSHLNLCVTHWSSAKPVKVSSRHPDTQRRDHPGILLFCRAAPSLQRRFWRGRAASSLPHVEQEPPTVGTSGRNPHSAVISHRDAGEIHSAALGSATGNTLGSYAWSWLVIHSLDPAAHSSGSGLALFSSGFRARWKRALLPGQLGSVNVCSLPEAGPRQWWHEVGSSTLGQEGRPLLRCPIPAGRWRLFRATQVVQTSKEGPWGSAEPHRLLRCPLGPDLGIPYQAGPWEEKHIPVQFCSRLSPALVVGRSCPHCAGYQGCRSPIKQD